MLTTGQAAKIKGVSRQAVNDAIATNKVRGTKVGRFWLVEQSDLDRWEIVGNRPKKRDA